jgi:hypothetical protein
MVSMDGVMQAPGGPEENPTGGFNFGGWAAPLADVDPVFGVLRGNHKSGGECSRRATQFAAQTAHRFGAQTSASLGLTDPLVSG